MKRLSFILILASVLVTSCANPVSAPQDKSAQTSITLSPSQRTKVAKQIWKNESGGKVDGLTAWNVGEEFPSLGIGHFIWYPKGVEGPFTESFPQFIRFANARGLRVPLVAQQADCPWTSREQFFAQFNGAEMKGLRVWLSQNLTVQADFIIAKSQASLGRIIQDAPVSERSRIVENYRKVASTTNGTYALIDYVNFKGEGINPKERYNGMGWGLSQVLQGMRTTNGGQESAREFAESAKRALDNRITNSPAARGEARWRAGWHKRCETYAAPF